MAADPADVLIIGAGASGAVVALRLAQAGFKVVCLEQGEWMDRDDYPGNKLDWELKARKDWATSPNVRGLAHDYPIVEDDTPVSPLMYNAVGGSTIIFAGRLAARPAVGLPGPLARRDRRRLADRLLRAPPLLLPDGPPVRRVGAARRPRLSARRRGRADAPAADRRGWAQGRPRPHEARLALVARVQLDQLAALRRAAAVRPAQHLPVGLQRGREGLDRPDPLAEGDRPRRDADHRRPREQGRDQRRRASRPARPGSAPTAPSTSSRRASWSWRRTRSGRRGCCCSRPARSIRTAWRTRRGSSGSG